MNDFEQEYEDALQEGRNPGFELIQDFYLWWFNERMKTRQGLADMLATYPKGTPLLSAIYTEWVAWNYSR